MGGAHFSKCPIPEIFSAIGLGFSSAFGEGCESSLIAFGLLVIVRLILELKLLYEASCPSVGWSAYHHVLKGRGVTLPKLFDWRTCLFEPILLQASFNLIQK